MAFSAMQGFDQNLKLYEVTLYRISWVFILFGDLWWQELWVVLSYIILHNVGSRFKLHFCFGLPFLQKLMDLKKKLNCNR